MTKLSLNKAAKEAGVAKSTLLEALNSGRMSSEKNEKGHWQIDPAELFRVFPKSSSAEQEKPKPPPLVNPQKTSQNSALEVEVKMLREQMAEMKSMNERERQVLVDQIESLHGQIERQSADHRQALAALTDQRKMPKRNLWGRIFG